MPPWWWGWCTCCSPCPGSSARPGLLAAAVVRGRPGSSAGSCSPGSPTSPAGTCWRVTAPCPASWPPPAWPSRPWWSRWRCAPSCLPLARPGGGLGVAAGLPVAGGPGVPGPVAGPGGGGRRRRLRGLARPLGPGGDLMPTYRLDLAYDGSGFRGWAANAGVRTVQGCLEEALAVALRHPVETTVAGRTDAGVHARGQVVSFTVPEAARSRPPAALPEPAPGPGGGGPGGGRGPRGLRRPPLRRLAHLPLLPRRRPRARPGPALEHLALRAPRWTRRR